MAMIRTVIAISALIVSFAAVLYKPVTLSLEVVGLTRPLHKIQNVHGEDVRLIPDTSYCEDLHHHSHSNLLFGASEEKSGSRWKWFPPFVESFILPSSYLLSIHITMAIDPICTYTICQSCQAR